MRRILHAQRYPDAARSGSEAAHRLGLADAPRDAIVNVRAMEISRLIAAIGESHFIARSSAVAESVQQRIQLRVLGIVRSPSVLGIARQIYQIDVTISGDSRLLRLGNAFEINPCFARLQLRHGDDFLKQSLRSPGGIVLCLGFRLAKSETRTGRRAHDMIDRRASVL